MKEILKEIGIFEYILMVQNTPELMKQIRKWIKKSK